MFIPRHPVVENQFCSYAESNTFGSAGIGGVVAYAGSVVYLDPTASDEEAMVRKMAHGVTEVPFGFIEQKVKVGYHSVHPTGFVMPGDLGSSDAIAQPLYNASGVITGHKSVPVGVAHLGIFDTVHYTCLKTSSAGVSTVTTKMAPGATLYPAANEARLTNSTVDSDGDTTADTGDAGTGDRCSSTAVARVLKGASAAKCAANIDNVTLYPIRIKLLV
jgi:hypothetical protein